MSLYLIASKVIGAGSAPRSQTELHVAVAELEGTRALPERQRHIGVTARLSSSRARGTSGN